MKEFTVRVRQVEDGEPDDRDMSDYTWSVRVECHGGTNEYGGIRVHMAESTGTTVGKAFAAAYLSVCHQLVNDDEE